MIRAVLIANATEATITADLLRRGKLCLAPFEIIASMIDTDPKIYGNSTGKVSVEKMARIARLMEVRVSLSLGDCIIFLISVFLNTLTMSIQSVFANVKLRSVKINKNFEQLKCIVVIIQIDRNGK